MKDPSEKRDARENALPQTVGEFGAATWLLHELGLVAGSYDVRMLSQVIAYMARGTEFQ